MNNKKVLITGACGFIGFHLALKFLKNSRNTVYGIDSLNNYYSVRLKKKRLLILKKKNNFFFLKKDLSDLKFCKKFFAEHKFDFIYHIAGQAGVLYSLKNPKSYLKNNIKVTKNLVWCIKKSSYKIKKFKFPSGIIVDVQGYEPFVLHYLLNAGYAESDITVNNKPKRIVNFILK